MSLRKLPEVKAECEVIKGFQWDVASRALEAWASSPRAASQDEATISILGAIGSDPYGDAFSAKRMAGALRAIGPRPVSVQINSPGGDFFEGVAIYNLLREHQEAVNVSIIGVAASAASFIAMAGDTVGMGRGSLLMVHNAWGAVIGNKNDFRAAADTFEKFDASMRSIYSQRTGLSDARLSELMDAETFMTAEEAVSHGFADSMTDDAGAAAAAAGTLHVSARNRIETILAKSGLTRTERRALLRELTGTPRAAEEPLHDAGFAEAVKSLINAIKN